MSQENEFDKLLDTAADEEDIRRVTVTLRDGRTQTFVLANLTMDWDMDQCEDAMDILHDALRFQTEEILAVDELKEILKEKNALDPEVRKVLARLEEDKAPGKINLIQTLQRIRRQRHYLQLLAIFYLPEGLDYDRQNVEDFGEFYRKLKTKHILGAIGNFFGGAGKLMAGGFRQFLVPLVETMLQSPSSNSDEKPPKSDSESA